MDAQRLFDPIRKKWVCATPEEQVRQSVIHWLIGPGGYQAEQIAIERLIPMGPTSVSNQRRFDIAIYQNSASGTFQLSALIECKAAHLSLAALQKAQRQVMSYQWHCRPNIVAVAAQNGSWYCLTNQPQAWYTGILTALDLKQLTCA